VVSLEGYLPYAIDQGPAAEDVRVLVPLAKLASTPGAPPPAATASAVPSADPQAPKPKAPATPRQPAAPPPGPKPPPSDINMQR
jgi:hypothetical protein